MRETKCVKGCEDMRKMHKVLALALGSVMGLAAFAACGTPESTGDAPNYKISFDNLPSDGITLDASVTTVSVADAKVVDGYDADGNRVDDWKDIATYQDGVFTAVSAGRVRYQLSDGKMGSVEVVPAYPTEVDNAYVGNAQDYAESGLQGEKVLGHTHDPSLIETRNWRGESIYYMYSTGWADTSAYATKEGEITTYGNAIHVSYDGMKTWEFMGRTFDLATRDADFVNTKTGEWLYGSAENAANTTLNASASWWAPDVVTKPDGSGYWLYTCVVDGGDGVSVNGVKYTRACILLYESESLEPGSFKPVLTDGQPTVLMQSSLNNGPADPGSVNAIDPQIIYSPDGKMYMAYASFGSGVYILELNAGTGKRADDKTEWVSHDDLRTYRDQVAAGYAEENGQKVGWTNEYYGTNIGKAAMEAPIIARHDNVTLMGEDGKELEGSGKTYYYSMQSYDGLSDNYQMWGGRSENVLGLYTSTQGGLVWNANTGLPATVNQGTQGNKYMGSFLWANKAEENPELDIAMPGHNDLFTTNDGTSVAAYITRAAGNTGSFTTQIHQYYLNSYGDIVINPNRYVGESSRPVSADELFKYTATKEGTTDAFKFEMVVLTNAARDNVNATGGTPAVVDGALDGSVYANNVSRTVVLKRSAENGNEGTIEEENGTPLGTWKMYGNGYIAFHFTDPLKGVSRASYLGEGTPDLDSGDKHFYGVVRTAWLNDQNRSGFTITCMGRTEGTKRSMSMFMNNYSTITGEGLVGDQFEEAAE